LKHSFIMLFIISVITVIQAYLASWMIPKYDMIEKAGAAAVSNVSKGFLFILVLAVIIIVFGLIVQKLNKKKSVA